MFKKFRQAILLTLLLCAVQPSYANSTFSIEDYIPQKFTDLKWNLDGNINGSTGNSTTGSLDDLRADYFSKNKNNNYSLRIASNMQYINETVNKSLRTSINVSSSLASYHSDSYRKSEQVGSTRQINIDDNMSSRKDAQFRISPQTTYKKYVKDEFFYSLSFSGRFDYSYSLKNKNEQEHINYRYYADSTYYNQTTMLRDYNNDIRYYNASFNFTVGNGRQYVGRYAFTAYNIIEELKKNGLLLAQPDKQIMVALTDILYQYENSHTIDNRIKQIEKYDVIYSFLLKNKIVVENNHLGMLLVQDAFEMFPKELRRFGFSKNIGFGLRYNYNSSHATTNGNTQRLSYRYQSNSPSIIDTLYNYKSDIDSYSKRANEDLWKYAVASLAYSKPIEMKWQIDASANGLVYFDSYVNYSNNYSFDIKKRYDLRTSFQSTYFYSSRTIWRSFINYSFSRYKNMVNNGIYIYNQRDETSWNFRIETSLEYRLNIPTTLQGTINYSNSDGDNNNQDDMPTYYNRTSFSFSISLLHYIY